MYVLQCWLVVLVFLFFIPEDLSIGYLGDHEICSFMFGKYLFLELLEQIDNHTKTTVSYSNALKVVCACFIIVATLFTYYKDMLS